MRHSDIIDRLGGNTRVGTALGRHPSTISRWRIHGVPPLFWLALVHLARGAGLDVTADDLERTSPRYGRHGSSAFRIRTRPAIKVQAAAD